MRYARKVLVCLHFSLVVNHLTLLSEITYATTNAEQVTFTSRYSNEMDKGQNNKGGSANQNSKRYISSL